MSIKAQLTLLDATIAVVVVLFVDVVVNAIVVGLFVIAGHTINCGQQAGAELCQAQVKFS